MLPTFYQVKASLTIAFSDEGPIELLSDSYELDSYLRKEPLPGPFSIQLPRLRNHPALS
jgi:hypothetical protein